MNRIIKPYSGIAFASGRRHYVSLRLSRDYFNEPRRLAPISCADRFLFLCFFLLVLMVSLAIEYRGAFTRIISLSLSLRFVFTEKRIELILKNSAFGYGQRNFSTNF